MRRRLAALLLLVLVLPAAALATHKDPKKQIAAADQRKAVSVLLKRSDFLAGWKKVPSTSDDTHFTCPGYDPNGADLVLTGEAEADFEHKDGFPAVYSFVNVYRTKQHALAAWTRTVKPAMARCLGTIFRQGAEEEGGKVTITTAGKIAFPKLAPRTAAFRVALKLTFTESGQTTTVPLTLYAIALGGGRGEAGLMTLAVGNTVAVADVRTLAAVMAKRFAAAKL
jgi:hypothetical protein